MSEQGLRFFSSIEQGKLMRFPFRDDTVLIYRKIYDCTVTPCRLIGQFKINSYLKLAYKCHKLYNSYNGKFF